MGRERDGTMKHKIGDLVEYEAEHYNVVGINENEQKYYLEPGGDDEIEKL
jgi:hypothetical protein